MLEACPSCLLRQGLEVCLRTLMTASPCTLHAVSETSQKVLEEECMEQDWPLP